MHKQTVKASWCKQARYGIKNFPHTFPIVSNLAPTNSKQMLLYTLPVKPFVPYSGLFQFPALSLCVLSSVTQDVSLAACIVACINCLLTRTNENMQSNRDNGLASWSYLQLRWGSDKSNCSISVGDISSKLTVYNLLQHYPDKRQVRIEWKFSKCLLIYRRFSHETHKQMNQDLTKSSCGGPHK